MARARQSAAGNTFGTSLAVAFPNPVLAGSLLVYGHTADVDFTSLTDTRNTPTLAIKNDLTIFSAVHVVLNALPGATTVTRANASGSSGLLIAEFVNWQQFGIESAVGAAGFSTTPSVGPVTCRYPFQLAVGFCGFEQVGAPYVTPSLWQEELQQSAAGGSCQMMTHYTASGGTFTASGTLTATPNWLQNLVTFTLTPLVQPNYANNPPQLRKRVPTQQRLDDLP